MNKIKSLLVISSVVITLALLYRQDDNSQIREVNDEPAPISNFERKHVQSPIDRYEILKKLTYKEGGENYSAGYQQKEVRKLLANQNLNSRKAPLTVDERGPSNVPGRARGLAVLPQDATHNTWVVGSSGGGIWKTTNSGDSWTDVSPEFSTLAIAAIAYCASEPNVMYAGSGEYIASSFTNINGDGVFKSTDSGDTWTHLLSTSQNDLWQSVTRIIVDPNDSDILLASTAPNFWGAFTSQVMKSIDGGNSWTSVYESSGGAIEQIVADPEDFSIMYGAQRGDGVIKSTDNGETWSLVSNGMAPEGRLEIGISPVDTDRLYAAAVGTVDTSQEADIYYSDDAGLNWVLVTDDNATVDVLGGQGFYDNTVLADPFDLDEFYIGGIGIYKYTLDTDAGIEESEAQFTGVDTGGTEAFMDRINFTAELDGGRIALGSASEFTSVELRFGPGMSQKAHRFLVPTGRGAGVADNEFEYQDYVPVPFEIWDVGAEPPRQLMASFRDQQRDGVFNLIENNTEGGEVDADNLHSREYLYFGSQTYSETPSEDIAKTGGHVTEELFFIWPFLRAGAVWDAENMPESTFKINWGTIKSGKYNVASIADPYGRVDAKNANVHPDHHNLVSVIHDEENKEWQIVNVNDGAAYESKVSTDPGMTTGDWTFAGKTMNTTQFYGADKAPGEDRYVAGAQDNGSWVSPSGEDASKTTEWRQGWGGDGFDAIWHPTDISKIIVTSQNLNVARSTNGGQSFGGATSGLNDSSPPFIGQFANSVQRPDVVFTLGADGVYKSNDFGGAWQLVDMSLDPNWFASSLMSIEISDATADVVWAGAAIASTGSLFLSEDGGDSFNSVPKPTLNDGYITGIGTHPADHKVVYMLFSYANSPKVLRSSDLGQTWEDISGFDASSTSTGFPDVAVYDIIVHPNETSTIWVGSEIGIIESNDDGATWHLLDSSLPNVSVWDFNLKDDQIVIATHGRGVWSYTLPEVPEVISLPKITSIEYEYKNKIKLDFLIQNDFDKVELIFDGEKVDEYDDLLIGNNVIIKTSDLTGNIRAKMVAYKNGIPFSSEESSILVPTIQDSRDSYVASFESLPPIDFFGNFNVGVTQGFSSRGLQSKHPYLASEELSHTLAIPVKIKSVDATFIYNDIALIEPSNDYVLIEGTTDGENWVSIIDQYDASFDDNWTDLYTNSTDPTEDDFITHEINLLDYFQANDEVVFRFRLVSNSETENWGWLIDDLQIQGLLLGADNFTLDKILVYPNPANEFIIVRSIGEILDESLEVDIVNVNGRLVDRKKMNNGQVSISNLLPGTYILQIKYNNKISNLKFVKK